MAEDDTAVHRALSKSSRVRLLRALTSVEGPRSAQELAEQVGVHLTTARAHLNVLVDAGLVEAERETRTTPGRPRVLYRPAADQPGPEARDYGLLAEVLASHLVGTTDEPAAQAKAAGRTWGQYLIDGPPPFTTTSPEEARRRVTALFDDLGFEPELDDTGSCILLHRCPFLKVAQRHPEVACSVHLGLLQGALHELAAPLQADDLEPFVEPTLCRAHLSTCPPN